MNYYDYIYEPEEDSFMLFDCTKKEIESMIEKNCLKKDLDIDIEFDSKVKVCEVGVGSGYTLINCALEFGMDDIEWFGSDINPKAIEYVKNKALKTDLKLNLARKSLLSGFDCKFDLIVFNTPYLPCEVGEEFEILSFKDRAIYGGKKGYEVIEEFIYEINDKLTSCGVVLMVFSSFSNLEYIKDVLEKNLFEFEIVCEDNINFEKIYCIKIWKSEILKKLDLIEDLKELKYLTKGKHSKVLSGKLGSQGVVVKIGLEKDIQIETIFLEKLRLEGFVPEMKFFREDFVVMEKLYGRTIKEFLESKDVNTKEIVEVLNRCLEITQRMDEMGINKLEMTNPYKHIFVSKITKKKEESEFFDVRLIDFERCLFSPKAKNTTQFLMYIRKQKEILAKNEIFVDVKKIMEISKRYKDKDVNKKGKLIKLEDII